MAFTMEEFINGALLAWGLTLLLLPVLLFAVLSIGCPTEVSSVPCSISDVSSRLIGAIALSLAGAVASVPAFFLFVLPAHALNRTWERSAHPAVHITVNAVLGLAVGATGSFGALFALGIVGLSALAVPVVLSSAVAATIAFPLAWRFTAARALNADRGIAAPCAAVPEVRIMTDSQVPARPAPRNGPWRSPGRNWHAAESGPGSSSRTGGADRHRPEFASTLTDGWVALWSRDDAGSIWSARIVGLRGAPVLLIALVVCGMLSGLVALVVTPLAGLVGRGLARVRHRAVHLCAQLALARSWAPASPSIGAPSGRWYPPLW
jgi:hypothetical protein